MTEVLEVTTESSFIAGLRIAPQGTPFHSTNPANERVVAEVYAATEDDLDQATQAAAVAQKAWVAIPPAERAQALWAWSQLIEAETENVAITDVRDMGKLLSEARMEIPAGARALRYWSSVAARPEDLVLPTVPGHFSYTRREPLGTIGIILPWNGPAITFISRVASAIAVGNAVIVKPSEYSPVSANRLAELSIRAGLPPGLVNVVHGDGDIGAKMVGHPGIHGVSFTGSVSTGRKIASQAAPSFKKTVLELGGKGPVIVFDDTDIEEAARASIWGCFQNAGQVCCAGTRVIVQRSRQAEFEDLLAKLTAKIVVGDPEEQSSQIGPVVSKVQLERIEQHIAAARSSGIEPTVGGGRIDGPGYYFRPTLFTGLDPQVPIMQEEVFGPVLGVTGFDSEEEAIVLANANDYGLAATVWTGDSGRMFRVADALESGVVWGNTPRLMDPSLPFGGYKNSGIGNAGGPAAIDGLTKVKRISLRTTPQPFAGWGM